MLMWPDARRGVFLMLRKWIVPAIVVVAVLNVLVWTWQPVETRFYYPLPANPSPVATDPPQVCRDGTVTIDPTCPGHQGPHQ